MNKDRLSKICLYSWLIIWPWQTKLILRSSASAYLEISLFLSLILLLIPLISWRRQEKINIYLWLAGLVPFLSIFWAEDKILAAYRCLILILGILLFNLIKESDSLKIKSIIKYFLIGLIAPAFLAIWQFFTQSTIATKYLGLAYHSAAVLGDAVIETETGRYLRAYGPFDHPNILGGVMVLGIILILYSSLKDKLDIRKRIFYLFSFAIFYLALLVSFSRAAILALLLSLPFIFINFWRCGSVQKKIIVIFSILIIGVSAVVIIPNHNLFFTRIETENRLEKKSISERELYFEQAKEVIKAKPFLGTGIGNYITELSALFPGQPAWYYQPVHDYWLLIWAELGIIGLLSAVSFWLYLFKVSFKNGFWPLMSALFIFSLFDHWLWTQPLELLIFFVLIGLIVGNKKPA